MAIGDVYMINHFPLQLNDRFKMLNPSTCGQKENNASSWLVILEEEVSRMIKKMILKRKWGNRSNEKEDKYGYQDLPGGHRIELPEQVCQNMIQPLGILSQPLPLSYQ